MKKLISAAALALVSASTQAIEIDTDEFFAYDYGRSQEQIFLSKKPCGEMAQDLGDAMTTKILHFCADRMSSTDCAPIGQPDKGWKKAVLYNTRLNIADYACWKDIRVNGKTIDIGLCDSGQATGYGLNCSMMKKSTFKSTKGLPRAPAKANF